MEGRKRGRERALYPPAVHILIPIVSSSMVLCETDAPAAPVIQSQCCPEPPVHSVFSATSQGGGGGGGVLEVTHSQSSPTCEKPSHGAEGANKICHLLHLRPELWSLRSPQAFGGPGAWSLSAQLSRCAHQTASCILPHAWCLTEVQASVSRAMAGITLVFDMITLGSEGSSGD